MILEIMITIMITTISTLMMFRHLLISLKSTSLWSQKTGYDKQNNASMSGSVCHARSPVTVLIGACCCRHPYPGRMRVSNFDDPKTKWAPRPSRGT